MKREECKPDPLTPARGDWLQRYRLWSARARAFGKCSMPDDFKTLMTQAQADIFAHDLGLPPPEHRPNEPKDNA